MPVNNLTEAGALMLTITLGACLAAGAAFLAGVLVLAALERLKP